MRGGNLYVDVARHRPAGTVDRYSRRGSRRAQPLPRRAPADAEAVAGEDAAVAGRTSGRGAKGTDSQEFLKKQELDLILAVKERKAGSGGNGSEAQKRSAPRSGSRSSCRRAQTANRLELCPDGKCVIAMVTDAANGVKNENVPNYVTESAYTEDINGPLERRRAAEQAAGGDSRRRHRRSEVGRRRPRDARNAAFSAGVERSRHQGLSGRARDGQ